MRTYQDIEQMAAGDYAIGLTAHYKPLANFIKERKYKRIAEIGTAYAGNAFHLLSEVNIDSLICVDPYLLYPEMPGFTCQEEYDTLYQFALNRLKLYVHAELWRVSSQTACLAVPPCDLIFLDASHDYKDVKWECENYSKIVIPGGVLSGHDYNIFEGVNKAVDEFSAAIGKPVQQLPGNIWYFDF